MSLGDEVAENIQLPEGWSERRFKMLVEQFHSGGTPATGNDQYWEGDIPWVSPKDMKISRISGSEDYVTALALEETNLTLLEPGHVLMVVRSGILRHTIPIATNSVPVTVNQDIKAMRLCPEMDADFFRYYIEGLQSDLLHLWRKPGTTVESLEYDYYSEHVVPVPPLDAQRRIARYLDEKTARIDGLIEKKRALLDRLAEKCQALITRAVTKGLNPDAPMKPSGIDWLGDIPAHWEVRRLNSFCDFQSGKAHEPFVEPDGEFICVNARFISTNGEAEKRCTENLTPANVGDILMVMSDLPNGRALARSFLVDDRDAYAVNQRVCRIRPHSGVPAYYSYLLNRNPQLLKFNDGKEQTHLSNSAFKWLQLFCPPEAEQIDIVEYLEVAVEKHDKASRSVERSINQLEEYRSALVTAAVTGKLEALQ